MHKQLLYSITVVCMLLLAACSRNSLYIEKLKTLDSLDGVLNVAISELQKSDTVSLTKSIEIYTTYNQFLEQNLSDTITKAEADCVRQFQIAGQNLGNYAVNRNVLLTQLKMLGKQISTLTLDVKNKSIEEQHLLENLSLESKQINTTYDLSSKQKQLFYSALEQFKNSLGGIEQLIKSHNNGVMPTIVKDTLVTSIP